MLNQFIIRVEAMERKVDRLKIHQDERKRARILDWAKEPPTTVISA